MTAHTCVALTRGCYRCDLSVDEIRGSIEEALRDARYHEAEARTLRREARDAQRAVDRWDRADHDRLAVDDAARAAGGAA